MQWRAELFFVYNGTYNSYKRTFLFLLLVLFFYSFFCVFAHHLVSIHNFEINFCFVFKIKLIIRANKNSLPYCVRCLSIFVVKLSNFSVVIVVVVIHSIRLEFFFIFFRLLRKEKYEIKLSMALEHLALTLSLYACL